MAIELKTESDTWWVKDSDLIQGGDPETEYLIRRLTLDKHREISRPHIRQANFRRPEKRDDEGIQDDLFDYVLVDWKKVNIHGQPVACDSWDHKRLIDVPRRVAMLDLAGMNEIAATEEARGESFRSA